jgi:hypothetical protein
MLTRFGQLTRTWGKFVDWSNVEIYTRGKLEIRRLDILLLLMGVSIAGYYAAVYNWQTAILGTAMYVLVLMCALWLM